MLPPDGWRREARPYSRRPVCAESFKHGPLRDPRPPKNPDMNVPKAVPTQNPIATNRRTSGPRSPFRCGLSSLSMSGGNASAKMREGGKHRPLLARARFGVHGEQAYHRSVPESFPGRTRGGRYQGRTSACAGPFRSAVAECFLRRLSLLSTGFCGSLSSSSDALDRPLEVIDCGLPVSRKTGDWFEGRLLQWQISLSPGSGYTSHYASQPARDRRFHAYGCGSLTG